MCVGEHPFSLLTLLRLTLFFTLLLEREIRREPKSDEITMAPV